MTTISIQIDGLIHISEDGTENVVGVQPVRANQHRTSYFQEAQGEEIDVLPIDLSLVARDHSGASYPRMRLNNQIAVEGVTRCFCGAKYWENDQCVDCGTHASRLSTRIYLTPQS